MAVVYDVPNARSVLPVGPGLDLAKPKRNVQEVWQHQTSEFVKKLMKVFEKSKQYSPKTPLYDDVINSISNQPRKKYAAYSAQAARCGCKIWRRADGSEVRVTGVFNTPFCKDYHWPDTVWLGEVTEYVREG